MLAGRTSRVWFIALLAGAFLAIVPIGASAASCQSWGASPPNLGSGGNALSGVAPISPCDVWAVGDYNNAGTDRTLAEHWNGKTWQLVASPNPDPMFNGLSSLSAASANNIWAVGIQKVASETLIEHWNGTQWQVVASPNRDGVSNILQSDSVVPFTSKVWAVGYSGNSTLTEFYC